ncbi:hypothetical protein ISP15_07600 [Dyella jejuensis]|uniref:Uncharacterized protein n=1 Tax=Dyella jejuensis TaxID=1432009 RepID=A0ABW8JGI0_9GAMM
MIIDIEQPNQSDPVFIIDDTHDSHAGDLISAEQHLADFNETLGKLEKSIGETRHAGQLAKDLAGRNWLQSAWGGMTGRNTKDLSGMVQDLGASLETTQLAVQLVMKLQIKKHGVLKGFHAALADKLEKLSKDTGTLDSNQREAAVLIISELKDHVAAQISYQDLVDVHEQKLVQFAAYAQAKDAGDDARDGRMEAMESDLSRLGEADRALDARIEAAHAELAVVDAAHAGRITQVNQAAEELRREVLAQQQKIAEVERVQQQWITRLEFLEGQLRDMASVKARLKRQALPAVALVLGVVAIALHFVH